MNTILQILTLLGAVTLFLFGLSLLSNGLQKVAGDGMRRILAAITSNPFMQILTGIGVTALTLITTGMLDFRLATAIMMGGNIGATFAANIAATVGNVAAKRTAISHTIMNTVGVIFVLIIYPWFLQAIGWMVELFGLPNPNTADLTLSSEPEADAVQKSLLYGVCVMHTLFNVVITLIFVWFVPQFVKLLCRIFPSKTKEEEFRLLYISGGPLSTPELSLDEAKQSLRSMIEHFFRHSISRNRISLTLSHH